MPVLSAIFIGQLVKLLPAGAGVHLFERLVQFLHLFVCQTGCLLHIGINVVQLGGIGGKVFQFAKVIIKHILGVFKADKHSAVFCKAVFRIFPIL